MDPNANDTPALGLPQPTPMQGGQPVDASAGAQAASAHGPAGEGQEELSQEWVEKAKVMVDKTKSDPFLETRELSKIKAAYLKARYNKDIKVSEDSD